MNRPADVPLPSDSNVTLHRARTSLDWLAIGLGGLGLLTAYLVGQSLVAVRSVLVLLLISGFLAVGVLHTMSISVGAAAPPAPKPAPKTSTEKKPGSKN